MDQEAVSPCKRCRTLNFNQLFYNRWSGRANPSCIIGTINEVLRTSTCGFCMLIRHTFDLAFGKRAVEEVLGWEAKKPPSIRMSLNPLDVTFDFLETSASKIALSIDFSLVNAPNDVFRVLYLERTRVKGRQDGHSPQIIALRSGDPSNDCAAGQFGQRVEPNRIYWPSVREWLAECATRHYSAPDSHGPSSRRPGDHSQLVLRVIDVDQWCIVDLPYNASYIALSYVWGKDQRVKLRKDNLALLTTSGHFLDSRNVPSKTILDAMQACCSLGYRYLWVDALCIVQDDLQNIQANVDSMQRIYSEASLTVVGAAGTNADYGLPGVSEHCPRTNQQMRVTINGITMSNRLETAIDNSHWNTRGWTFQEKMLSSRLLNFTTSQVSYQCDEGCNQEEQFHSSGNDTSQFLLYDNKSQLDFETYDIFEVYALAVSGYTSRSITNPMDKVRAFDGIIQLLQNPFKGQFLHGLPVTMFEVALLWIPAGRCVRANKSFPSWSWAGWDGVVHYDYMETDSLINLSECTVVQCEIALGSSKAPVCSTANLPMDELVRGKWTRHYDEESCGIFYKDSEDVTKSYRYPRMLTHSDCRLPRSPTSVLTISGRISTFRLTGQHSGLADFDDSCQRGYHMRCCLAVLDHEGHAAGAVVVDSHLVPQLQNRDHKFLAISRSTLSRQDDDISWDEETKSFRKWDDHASEAKGNPDTTYEAYKDHFKDWNAELPKEPSTSLPLRSNPIQSIDRTSVFQNGEDMQLNRSAFDSRYYSDNILWPILNVLLLSENVDGIVERLGVGQIHIDAFGRNAKEEVVLLG